MISWWACKILAITYIISNFEFLYTHTQSIHWIQCIKWISWTVHICRKSRTWKALNEEILFCVEFIASLFPILSPSKLNLTFLRVFLLLEPTKTTSYQTTETPWHFIFSTIFYLYSSTFFEQHLHHLGLPYEKESCYT